MTGFVCKRLLSGNFDQFHSSLGYDSTDLKILVRWIIASYWIIIRIRL